MLYTTTQLYTLIFHSHLLKSARLKALRFFIPNPPSSSGLNNFSHLTQFNFLSSSLPPQRNFLNIHSSLEMIPAGVLKKERK
jgi:hypothetical protein